MAIGEGPGEGIDRVDRERPLGRGGTALSYGLAGGTYRGMAIFHKGLPNWVVGPIWLVVFVVAGPALADRVRCRAGRAAPAGEADAGDHRPRS